MYTVVRNHSIDISVGFNCCDKWLFINILITFIENTNNIFFKSTTEMNVENFLAEVEESNDDFHLIFIPTKFLRVLKFSNIVDIESMK